MKATYDGVPLVQQIDFTVEMTDTAGVEQFRAVAAPREWTMHLAPGQRWPDDCKRGRRVTVDYDFGIGSHTMSGVVKFRRLNKLVLLVED
jgi:hypothetical protein